MINLNKKTGKYEYTSPNGKVYSSHNKKYIEYRAGLFSNASDQTVDAEQPEVQQFCINTRFEFLANFVTMVAEKIQPSVIVAGDGGLGKSYVVTKSLAAAGLVDVSNVENFMEGERLPTNRFRVVKGYSTPKALYRLLYENKDSVLVLDDIDSTLTDPTCANLLKGALDTTRERILTWNSEATFGDDGLPRAFRFTGGVVVITNLPKHKIPGPLRTRSICVDVSMTLVEKIARMSKILFEDDFMPEVDAEIKQLALKTIDENKESAKEISMRSLHQVIRIAQMFGGEKFQDMSKYALTNT